MKKQRITDSFTIEFSGLSNKIITPVGISEVFDPTAEINPSYKIYNTNALWDTGATGSVITESTAKYLGIVPTGKIQISHAGGKSFCYTYIVNLFLPNNVIIYGVPVTECVDIIGSFGVIIGMDIIVRGDMAITNSNNKTVMSFRMPSLERIDFVKKPGVVKSSGVGRNADCPCGSGKKYKKCCMK